MVPHAWYTTLKRSDEPIRSEQGETAMAAETFPTTFRAFLIDNLGDQEVIS